MKTAKKPTILASLTEDEILELAESRASGKSATKATALAKEKNILRVHALKMVVAAYDWLNGGK